MCPTSQLRTWQGKNWGFSKALFSFAVGDSLLSSSLWQNSVPNYCGTEYPISPLAISWGSLSVPWHYPNSLPLVSSVSKSALESLPPIKSHPCLKCVSQEEPRLARLVFNKYLEKGLCTQRGGYLLDSCWVLPVTFHKIFSYILFCRFIVLFFNFRTVIHCNYCRRSKVRDHIHFLLVDMDIQLFQYHLMKIPG